MRVTEKKTVTQEREVLLEKLCDICGEAVPPEGYAPATQIEVKRTEHYPEGGTAQEYDVCPTCWETVIVPLFKTGPNEFDY